MSALLVEVEPGFRKLVAGGGDPQRGCPAPWRAPDHAQAWVCQPQRLLRLLGGVGRGLASASTPTRCGRLEARVLPLIMTLLSRAWSLAGEMRGSLECKSESTLRWLLATM